MNDFQVGDIVTHKSKNSITMVVLEKNGEKVFCEYYCDQDHLFKQLWFYKIALRKI